LAHQIRPSGRLLRHVTRCTSRAAVESSCPSTVRWVPVDVARHTTRAEERRAIRRFSPAFGRGNPPQEKISFETSTGIEIRNLWHGNIVRKWKLKTLEYENIQGISRCSQHSVVNFCRQKERVNFAILKHMKRINIAWTNLWLLDENEQKEWLNISVGM